MNPYLVFILVVLVAGYLIGCLVSLLNLRSLDPRLPELFADVYDPEEYARSQEYTRTTTRFSLFRETLLTPLLILFILYGGFNGVDQLARSLALSEIPTGLVFTALLLLLSGVLGLPFSIYSTFVIEEQFGFNRTTPTTFIVDILKSIFLAALLGGPLLAFVFWFFTHGGPYAWLYCWGIVVLFLVVVQFLAPVLIMPLFNKYTPLAEGELHHAITSYAHEQGFALQGIYTMDGSKRSSRANAFFTGFGRFRRIVFFDTLIDKMSPEEIVAVLAHEMGHFKHRHILKMMAASMLQIGIMFFILSLFLNNEQLFAAFSMEKVSIHASLVFFAFLYTPISAVIGVVAHYFSRRYEYEADTFAVATSGMGKEFISGLKKLSVTSLSNLTPHPLHVFLHYSHPPVLERIQAINTQVAEHGD